MRSAMLESIDSYCFSTRVDNDEMELVVAMVRLLITGIWRELD